MFEKLFDLVGNVDLRIFAALLAVISLAGGIFASFYLLLAISVIILVVGFCILFFTRTGPPGTSAGLGLFFLVGWGCLFLIAPAWLWLMV